MNRCALYLLLLLLGFSEMAVLGALADKKAGLPPSESIPHSGYDGISAIQAPPAPIIRLSVPLATGSVAEKQHSFPFKDHHVNLTVVTGDKVQEKDWLIQTRLDTDFSEWSTPAPRRSFEFTNLPVGSYRFEARAINSSGMAGEISHLFFVIQPPWYRTNWAYAGYVVGFVLSFFGFFRIRDRRIRKRNQELKALVEIRTEALIKASAAKDEFLAAISHEIRNPMNGIIGIAESINPEGLDQDSRNKLGLLRQCTRHLSSLLDDILDFSRLQPDAFSLDLKVFNVPELMESIAALTAAESEKCGIPVEIAVSPGVPRQLTGDPRRIRQILLNYINNALKYSYRGKVSITVWRNKTTAGFMEVFFAVSDDGPGISPEEQDKLFTRFGRGSTAQTRGLPGTGLGLSLCKTLAEKMGGQVWLKSEAGKGSCFYFSAVLATTDDETKSAPSSYAPFSTNLKNALVVDDEEYNRVALTGQLEALGITVYSAAGEPESLALAKRHDFNLIFIDYSIPGLNGPAIARAIRALPNQSAQSTIFATTAFNTSEKRAECLAAGMNAFLGKPVTMERLRLALGATLTKAPSTVFHSPIPADPLVNLRLLATKKCVVFADELKLYFSELETELHQLLAALQKEDSGRASYYAHLLYGRCSFINERDLDLTLRKIEATAALGRWDEARSTSESVQSQFNELGKRLFSDSPVVQSE